MKKYRLAPGNVLVNWYIKKRLRVLQPGSFVEVGAGVGFLSAIFLKYGATGHGYELNPESVEINRNENSKWIESGKYHLYNRNFLTGAINESFDVVFSHNVIEHLDGAELDLFFKRAQAVLNNGGRIISIVPAGIQFWGIEDDVAGHVKRYSVSDVQEICKRHNMRIADIAYLTYPLSNILKPLGDRLIQKNESGMLTSAMKERTINSSLRRVEMKTEFPGWFRFIINEITLVPFIFLQMINIKNTNSLTLYFELEKNI